MPPELSDRERILLLESSVSDGFDAMTKTLSAGFKSQRRDSERLSKTISELSEEVIKGRIADERHDLADERHDQEIAELRRGRLDSVAGVAAPVAAVAAPADPGYAPSKGAIAAALAALTAAITALTALANATGG